MSLKVDQGLKTKNEIIEHAQAIFSKNGYANTRFDLIGKDLSVTSGAMYHHFKNKKDLFDCVVQRSAEKISKKVEASADKENNIIESIIAGSIAFIREASSHVYSKILLEDSISVLGWKRWKEIDEATSELKLVEAIEAAKDENLISKQLDSKVVSRFLSGGINELALWVSHQPNKKDALKKSSDVIRKTVTSLLTKEDV